MRKQLSLILAIGLIATSLSACGKDNQEQEVKRIEASNAAESKEPTERKYEDTNKEPVIAPDKNNNSVESTEDSNGTTEEETVDTSGILGYWSDNLGNSFQFFHDTDDNGNGLEELSYSGFFVDGELNFYGVAETDNATYIKCEQREYSSTIEEEPVEPQEPENTDETQTINNREWVFDEEGKIVGYTDETGNQYPVDEADMKAVELFNNSVGQDIPEDENAAIGEEVKQVEYKITKLELDKENNCSYMDITYGDKQFSLVRYN